MLRKGLCSVVVATLILVGSPRFAPAADAPQELKATIPADFIERSIDGMSFKVPPAGWTDTKLSNPAIKLSLMNANHSVISISIVPFAPGETVETMAADGVKLLKTQMKGFKLGSSTTISVNGHPAMSLQYSSVVDDNIQASVYQIGMTAGENLYIFTLSAKTTDMADLIAPFEATVASSKIDAAIKASPAPAPAAAAAPVARDLAQYRAKFPTTLTVHGPPPKAWQSPVPLHRPGGVDEITYDSGDLKLKAWISRVPKDGKLHPAVVFCHGGFWFGDEDWAVLQPFLDAGFVVMAPRVRGENGNPGEFEYYFDEANDVIAAGKYVAAIKGIDPARIYVSGHSAGGTLATLAVMMDNPFAMSAPIGASLDMRIMVKLTHERYKSLVVFDPADAHEVEGRSAVLFTASLRSPITLFHGDKDGYETVQKQFVTLATHFKKEASLTVVPGDHGQSLPNAIPEIVKLFGGTVAADLPPVVLPGGEPPPSVFEIAPKSDVAAQPDADPAAKPGPAPRPRPARVPRPAGAGDERWHQQMTDMQNDLRDLPPGASKTAIAGGYGGGAYLKIDKGARPVIGFRIELSESMGKVNVHAVTPLFDRTPPRPEDNNDNVKIVLAKPGYAVSGLLMTSDHYARSMQVIFGKLAFGRINIKDTYTSETFADPQDTPETTLGNDGRVVLGTYGKQGMHMDGIGLVMKGPAPK